MYHITYLSNILSEFLLKFRLLFIFLFLHLHLAFAQTGAALDLDGSNDVVLATGVNLANQSFTVEYWAKPRTLAAAGYPFTQGTFNLTSQGLQVGFETATTFKFGLWNNDLDVTIAADNNWHHWAAVYEFGVGKRLYRDGVLIGSGGGGPFTGNTDIFIGRKFSPGSGQFNGTMDELRVWTRALCQAEIVHQMNCELLGTEPNLAIYYQFNQGIASGANAGVTTVNDIAGVAQNGTLTNFALTGATSNWVAPGGVTSGTGCSPYLYPEINLVGNTVSIVDGDNTPSTSDDTDFGNQVVCTGTLTKTFTIQNTGTLVLNVSSIILGGTNAADFSISGVTTPFTVAAGSSTTFNIVFNPSALGVRTATISIANDDCDENPYNFSIQGTGVDPEINVRGNTTTWVTITDGDITPSTTDHTDFTSANSCPNPVTEVRTYRIENTGTSNLTVSNITLTGTNASDFSVGGITFPAVISAGSLTTFTVSFAPVSGFGTRVATVNIANDDCNESPYDFAIQGTAVAPEINIIGNTISIVDGDATPSLTDHTDFGSQSVCAGTITRTFTLQNQGNSILASVVGSVAGTNASDFTISGLAGSQGANSSSTFTVIFNPSAPGVRTALIQITSSDCDESPYDFSIQGTGIDPEIDVTGNSVSIVDGDATPTTTDHTDFGNQSVCSGTITRTFTIANSGNSNLTVSTLTLTGANAADFTVGGITLPATIAAAGTTTFTVTFNPSLAGIRAATVNIGNNDCNEATYDFAIQGTGIDPEINVQGNSTTIVDGDVTPTLTDHTDFGNQSVCGGSITRTFTIQNIATSSLIVTGITITGVNASDFTLVSVALPPLGASASATFSIVFDPSAPGTRTATVNITSNDCDEATYDFSIQGGGEDPEIDVRGNALSILDGDVTPTTADHTDFGNQSVCSGTITRTFTLANSGNSNLTVSTLTLSGANAADFTVGGITLPATIAAAGTTTFTLTFDPSLAGTRTATVNIGNNDCNEAAYDFAIQGTGIDPEIDVTGNSVSIVDGDATPSAADHTDFGSQSVCSGTITRTFTIANNGNSNLTVSTLTLSGANAADFTVGGITLPATIAAVGTTTFTVTFDPGLAGTRTATVNIGNNDCNEAAYDFAIQGTGIDPEIDVTGNSVSIVDGDATPSAADHTDFGSQSVCSGTITRTFTIANSGNSNLTVSTLTLSGANAADFTVGGITLPATIAAAGTTTFTVTFDPSLAGTRTATVNIGNNDCNESAYDFAIQGTGIDPEIDVTGNSVSIVDGDATPSATDYTDFGNQSACSGTTIRTFTIQNTGNSNLTISNITLTGPGVAVSGFSVGGITLPTIITASGSTTFTITYDPSLIGTRNATVNISNDDCYESIYDFLLEGTGIDPEINVTGNSVSIADGDATPTTTDHTDFGSQSVCSGTITRTFTIANNGNSNLTVSTLTLSGANAADFTVGGITLPATIAAVGTTTFTLTFDPSLAGTRTATVNIGNNDCNESAYDFAIQGTGIDPEIDVTGNSVSIVDGDATPTTTDHTDFGSQSVCSGTIIRTFTLANSGNSNLTVSTLTLSGVNAADFTVGGITLPATIAAAGTTTFTLTFDPSLAGTRTATVNIGNNDCNEAAYDFAIQGTGIDPEIDVTGNSVSIADGDATPSVTDHTDFGNQSVCSGTITRTFTIANSGNSNLTVSTLTLSGANAADFTVGGITLPATIAAAGTTTFTVTFDPSLAGTRTATVNIGNNDCNEAAYDFAIQGTGIDPEIDVTGNSVSIVDGDATPTTADHTDFGNQSVCSGTITRTFTIANSGNSNLTVSTLTLSGANAADFTVGGITLPATIAAAGTTTFTLTFDPSLAGTRTATVNIGNNDCNEAAYDFAIQGTGIDPEIDVTGNSVSITDGDATPSTADHSDFGSQSVCSGTITRTFTIANSGNSNLTVSTLTLTGVNAADFTVGGITLPATIAAAGTTTFTLTFDPSLAGIRTATVNIGNNDCNEAAYDFAIQGTGIDPEIDVTGNSVSIVDGDVTPTTTDHTDFGNQSVCSGTITRTFTIANSGNSNLTVSTLTLSGANAADFTVGGITLPATIAAAGTTTFTVTFDPSLAGTRTATVNIGNNDCNESAYDFAIQGTGIDPEIDVTGNSVSIVDGDVTPTTADHTDFGSQSVCSGTITRTFTIANSGNSNLTVSTLTLSGANAADFTVGGITLPATIAAAGTTTFTVTFDPSLAGTRTATVNIGNDDCDANPFNFDIQGTGIDSSPTAAVLGSDATICFGNSANINVDITGGNSPYTIVYNDGSNHTITNYISGTNISVSPTVTTTYTLVSVTDASNCPSLSNVSAATITVNSSFTIPPTNGTLYVADYEQTDGAGWTHYYDDAGTSTDGCDDYLLLSLRKNGNNIGTIGDGTFSVQIGGNAGQTHITPNANYVTSSQWHIMNRHWNVMPTTQPISDVNVKFYFTTPDFTAVQAALIALGYTISSPTDMYFFKVNGSYNIDPVNGHANIPEASSYPANGYWQYDNGVASPTQWEYSIIGSDHAAEYVVSSFSGGSGGASIDYGAFPVTLSAFSGQANDLQDVLSWTTLSEQNFSHFELMQSQDMNNWTEIASIAGKGVSTYSYTYTPENPLRNFYQLRLVDLDGSESLSNVVEIIRGAASDIQVSLYPNPVKNTLFLNLSGIKYSKAYIANALGQKVWAEDLDERDNGLMKLDLSSLAPGVYTFVLDPGYVIKFVKD